MKYLLVSLFLFVTPLSALAETVRWVYDPHTRRHHPVVTQDTPTEFLLHRPPDNPGVNFEALERDGCYNNGEYTYCIHSK